MTLAILTLQVSTLAVAALAAVSMLRRQSASLRHWILVTALACAAALPALARVAPSWQPRPAWSFSSRERPVEIAMETTTALVPERAEAAHPPTQPVLASPAPAYSLTGIAVAVWLSGALFGAGMLIAGFARLRWIAATALPLRRSRWNDEANRLASSNDLRPRVRLLVSERASGIMTWGFVRPIILLPPAAVHWPEGRIRIALLHELAHVRRGDWLAQLLAEGVRAIYWFNPLVWIACRRLRQESERACDDEVINAGVDATDYATALVEIARAACADRQALPALGMARVSGLEGRIAAMLNMTTNRRPPTRRARIATALLIASLAVPLAGAGQRQFHTYSGTVLDTTNAYLPGTTLTLTNRASKARHEVTSDARGRFEFVGLPDGGYTLLAERPGFATLLDEQVVIAGRDLTRIVDLQVGSLEETVSITATPGSTTATTEPAKPMQRPTDAAMREEAEARLRRAEQRCRTAPPATGGGQILPPAMVVRANPVYPQHLAETGVGGVVELDALIGTDGRIRDQRLVSSPHPDLERAAQEAVSRWEFTPTLLNCTPIEVRMKVTARFNIMAFAGR